MAIKKLIDDFNNPNVTIKPRDRKPTDELTKAFNDPNMQMQAKVAQNRQNINNWGMEQPVRGVDTRQANDFQQGFNDPNIQIDRTDPNMQKQLIGAFNDPNVNIQPTRGWGETIPGMMYPAVEGPGNPSWERRNPQLGGKGDFQQKFNDPNVQIDRTDPNMQKQLIDGFNDPNVKMQSQGNWGETQPTGTPITMYTAVPPPPGMKYEYNDVTGERRAVPINGRGDFEQKFNDPNTRIDRTDPNIKKQLRDAFNDPNIQITDLAQAKPGMATTLTSPTQTSQQSQQQLQDTTQQLIDYARDKGYGRHWEGSSTDPANVRYTGSTPSGGHKVFYENLPEIAQLMQEGKIWSMAEAGAIMDTPERLDFYRGRQTQAQIQETSAAEALEGRKIAEAANPASPYYQGPGDGWTGGSAGSGLSIVKEPSKMTAEEKAALEASQPVQAAGGQQAGQQYQILNVEAMQKYQPDQYERLPDGRVMLKVGIQPIEGTVKTVGGVASTAPVAGMSKANELQIALDRVASGSPGGQDQTNIDYAKSKGMLATLYSSTGEKKVVAVGSDTASKLLNQGWALKPPDTTPTGTITADGAAEQPIDVGGISDTTSSDADITKGSVEQTQKNIADYLKTLEKPESDLDKQLEQLTGDISTGLEGLEGRGEYQLSQEEQQQVQQKKEALTGINNQITTKLAEIDALNKQYESEFMDIEGKPIALSRMQGQQAQIYRTYQIRKNELTSEAGLLQAQEASRRGCCRPG